MRHGHHRRSFLQQAAKSAVTAGWLGCCSSAACAESGSAWFVQGVGGHELARIRGHVQTFMRKHAVPGLSLAMSYRGKLKLLVCSGYADRARQEPVQLTHRFRVASVSKPLTSILVMMLRQQGALDIDRPVFGPGVLGCENEIAQLGSDNKRRLEAITTRHLLEHTAGGWSNQSNDPMFAGDALGLSHDELIRWTLSHRSLEHDPGANYAYSNFGYCLIGRVIEKTVRMRYESAFKAYVLQPFSMGHLAMRVGGNTLSERQANEVVYYGQNEDPYHRIMDVRRMDAHGGWVATPADLVRLVNRVDGFASPSDLLSQDSLRVMTTPSSANPNYAKGWSINRSNNWWHTGSFNGGSSILARIHDHHCWAMSMNTRSKHADYSGDLDGLPWKIKNSVQRWGGHDLFS